MWQNLILFEPGSSIRYEVLYHEISVIAFARKGSLLIYQECNNLFTAAIMRAWWCQYQGLVESHNFII
ncbi:hypothetical protein T4D_307 [Trichinella pseudospiralis]|uniref:Uncharacterized protein n=1 Tax=Trichinella pseudospiralis TaxID=6337 RepID=A0A0V1FHA7_TRIPS|nr:hypothetical protein T4D_307 [Trichinella pseudospiralis]